MLSESPSTPMTTNTAEVNSETTPFTCDEWWSPISRLDRHCPIQSDDFKGSSNAFTVTKSPDGTVTKISTYVTGEKNVETETPDGVITFESHLKDGIQTRIVFLNNPGGERPDRFYENLKTGKANIELGNLAQEESTIDLKKISTDVYSGKHNVYGTEIVFYRDSIPGKPSSGNWVTVTKEPGGNTTTVYRNNDGSFRIINTNPNGFSTVTVEKYDNKNSERYFEED